MKNWPLPSYRYYPATYTGSRRQVLYHRMVGTADPVLPLFANPQTNHGGSETARPRKLPGQRRYQARGATWTRRDHDFTEERPNLTNIDSILCKKAAGSFLYASAVAKIVESNNLPTTRLSLRVRPDRFYRSEHCRTSSPTMLRHWLVSQVNRHGHARVNNNRISDGA